MRDAPKEEAETRLLAGGDALASGAEPTASDVTNKSTAAFALLQAFLDRLDADRITYRLDRVRPSSVLVEVYLPGTHWEVEFFSEDRIEVERFAATEDIRELRDVGELVELLELDQYDGEQVPN